MCRQKDQTSKMGALDSMYDPCKISCLTNLPLNFLVRIRLRFKSRVGFRARVRFGVRVRVINMIRVTFIQLRLYATDINNKKN